MAETLAITGFVVLLAVVFVVSVVSNANIENTAAERRERFIKQQREGKPVCRVCGRIVDDLQ